MGWGPVLWVAGTIAAITLIAKSPAGQVLRWLWNRNIGEPLSRASARVVRDTVSPMIDEVKAASRSQHDEQNGRLQQISDHLADHSRRLILIEDHITRPKGGHR